MTSQNDRRIRRGALSARSGLSLIEVTLALALFASSITVVIGYLISMHTAVDNLSNHERCIREAQAMAEYVRNQPWERLCAGDIAPGWQRPARMALTLEAQDVNGAFHALPCAGDEPPADAPVFANPAPVRIAVTYTGHRAERIVFVERY